MLKVEGGGGPIDSSSSSRLRVTIFFFEASRVYNSVHLICGVKHT